MDRRPRWVAWLFVALVLAGLAAVRFGELAPTASSPRRRAARVLQWRGAMTPNPILNTMCWPPTVARLALGVLTLAMVGVGYAVGHAIPVS